MNDQEQIIKQIQENPDFRKVLTKENFYWFFVTYFPHYITCPTADFQKEIFNLIQNEELQKITITAFRGSAKSTIATLALPIWAMVGKPTIAHTLLVSLTQGLAKQILTNIKQELSSNELLMRDFGPFSEVAEEWRSNSLVIPRYNSRISAISQSERIRGLRHRQYRPDLIIIDDVEDLESVKTRESRDNLWNWFSGEIKPIGDSGTRIITVGNLLHLDSLMMRIKQNVQAGAMDGIYKEFPLLDSYGNIAWPGKYPTMEDIEAKRKDVADEAAWYREFLLKIIADEDRIVKGAWIKYYDTLPDFDRYPARLIAIGVDLAISLLASANLTALVPAYIVGYGDNLQVYILPYILNKRLDFPQTIQAIKILTEKLKVGYRPHPRVYIESVGYQSAAAQQLIVEHVLAEEVRIPQLDKRSRLSIISPLIEQGKVFFPRSGAEVLIDQLLNFGVEKYDDLVDAFTLLMSKIIETDHPTNRSTHSDLPPEPDPHPGLTWSLEHMNDLGFDLETIKLNMVF